VRALNPWPGTSLWVSGGAGAPLQRLKVKRAGVRRDISGPVGKIFEKAGMALYGTTGGALELLAVQWDGKKEVDAAGFLNGLKGRGQELPLQTTLVHASPGV
jgi:methionyl-tRNA formyltransferase